VPKTDNSQNETFKKCVLSSLSGISPAFQLNVGGTMKASLKFILPVCLLLLSGCAQIVTKNYAPYRGGTVKYNTGWFMAEKNREKAVEEMNQYCAPGRPQILREDSKLEGTGQVYTNGSSSGKNFSSTSTESKEANMYIQFKCTKAQRTAHR
jgi:hypothetical protein